MRRIRPVLLPALIATLAACGPAGPGAGTRPAPAAAAPEAAPEAATAVPGPEAAKVAVIARGEVDGVPWQVDLLDENGLLCTQASVDRRATGHGCDPPVSKAVPVNVAVDGLDDRVLLVYGAADPSVAGLLAHSRTGAPRRVAVTATSGGRGFFAYAVKPGTATDLTALDSDGREVFSAGDKIWQFEDPGR
ncbi:hypothetical protein AB0D10_04210 [Kitasatospora sp. NPDC048545]|uniref:hypothetical protein n=1 Tax=Kitasatospora sp. NPDC048545 TaxID=3157208 RepID=UPI0033E8C3AA